jgi:hypothetical protein
MIHQTQERLPEEAKEMDPLDDLVGLQDNPEADEAIIARQIEQIERNTIKRQRMEEQQRLGQEVNQLYALN